MIGNEVEDIPNLEKQETSVDVDQGNGKDPYLSRETKNELSVAYGEACSFATEEGAVDVALECEVRKDVCVGSINEDPKVLEEGKDTLIVSVNTNINEISMMESVEKEGPCFAARGTKEDSSSSFSGKKLLVLDLNGLLVDIVSTHPKDYVPHSYIGRKAIFKRPFCEDLLKFCFEKFEVGIWSSRSKEKLEIITDFLLGDMKSKLLFCWGIYHCTKITYGSLGNKDKYVAFKELKQLWEKHDQDLPWKKGDFNETNTVLLDDSPHKALLNPQHTAVFPHSYHYKDETDNSLGKGGDLRLYLEKLAEADNVQEFIKNHPFGKEPMSEASQHWEFYRNIIDNLPL